MSTKRKNTFKLFFRWGILALLAYMGIRIVLDKAYAPDFEAYCPFGGLQALGSYLTRESLACTMTSAQIMMGIMLVVGVLAFSKLFCGYICPLGTVGEWLGKLGEKLKIRFTIKGIADSLLRALKYGLLFVTFYFTLSSSELFCKKYDPYFGIVSGFGSDVVILYVAIALTVLILGSVFIRLFWCKYLCPLGALSNIFRFFWWFALVMVLYIVLTLTGTEIPLIWPIAVTCAGGFLLEVLLKNKATFPFVHITRNEESCINCSLCSKSCPQAIDVASLKVVKNVDCNLCGDCLHVCPEKDTLQINKRNMKWFPGTALALLVLAGLFIGMAWEVPTIDDRWASPDEIHHAAIFKRSGLKNIKCFGSSRAFSAQMQEVKGVLGVATYVGSHTVKIYYDPLVLNEQKLNEIIFTPSKRAIIPLSHRLTSVKRVKTTIDNFFDSFDAFYLQQLLKENTSACGYISKYSCPVEVEIFFPDTAVVDIARLKKVIESKRLTYPAGEKQKTVALKFRVVTISKEAETIPFSEYATIMYTPFKAQFNNYEKYDPQQLSAYEILLKGEAGFKKQYPLLVSHLSNDTGVVALETHLNDSIQEVTDIVFIPSLTRVEKIMQALKADSLHFTYSDGEKGTAPNPFRFRPGKEIHPYMLK